MKFQLMSLYITLFRRIGLVVSIVLAGLVKGNSQTIATPAEKANANYITAAVIQASIERRENNDNKSSGEMGGEGGSKYIIDGPSVADRTSKQGYTLIPRAPQGFWWYVSCGTIMEYYDDLIIILFGNANCNTSVIKLFNAGDTLMASYTVSILGDPAPLSAGQILTGSQTIKKYEVPGKLFASPATGGNCPGNYQYQWQYSYNDSLYGNMDNSTIGDSVDISAYADVETIWFRRRVICGSETMYTASVAVFVVPDFYGGVITTPSRVIPVNTAPPALETTPAAYGNCNNTYTYKWQISSDGYVYSDIPGATTENYSHNTPLTATKYFRRKAFCDTLTAVTNSVVMQISQPPVVIQPPPKTSIDTLLQETGINIQADFGIISDSIANGRPAPNPALDSLDILSRQKLELFPFGAVSYSGIDQSDLAALATDTLVDNIQQRLLNDSLGITDTSFKPVQIPYIQDSTIQYLIADSNFHALDSLVRLSPSSSFEDVMLLLDQQQNQNLPEVNRSYIPSATTTNYMRGAVINGPSVMPFGYQNQVIRYTGSFYFPPTGSVKWIPNGGTVVGQNTNPAAGVLYADVIWNTSPGSRFIALYDMNGTRQFDLLNVYIIGNAGTTYPPLQMLFYGQTPCLLQGTPSNTSGTGFTYQFKWQQRDIYASNSVWTDIAGSNSTTTQPTGLVNYQLGTVTRPWMMYRLESKVYNSGVLVNTSYTSPASIQLEKPDGGTITSNVTHFPFNTVPVVTQTASTGGYTPPNTVYQYVWEYSVQGGPWTEFGYGQAYPNYAIRYSNTKIRRKVYISAGIPVGQWVPTEYLMGYSNEINFTTFYQTADWENRNYIRENIVLVKGVNYWEDADLLTREKKIQTTTYLDGISRPMQTVGKGTHYDDVANQWYDMVQSITYEAGGRVDKSLLPYPTMDNPGKFKTNALTAQQAYYQTKFSDNNAFAKVEYDGSPLNQVLKSYAPGESWVGNNVKVTGNVEIYNAATELVRRWTIGYNEGEIPETNTVWPNGNIIKSWALDEKGKKVVSYTDMAGNVVLKKVQLTDEGQLTAHHDGWLCTYYVYDDFNQLRFTITPKAVKEAKNNNWVLTQTIADELCFWYDYDELGRPRAKKTPGKGVEYLVYDKRNRPVFTQDANSRAKGEWLAVLYDELNRPAISGIYKNTQNQTQLQTTCNNISSNTVTVSTTDGGSFKVNYTLFTSADLNNTSVFVPLSFSYYDGYTFSGKKDFEYNEVNRFSYRILNGVGNINEWGTTLRTTGMATGGKTRVLNNSSTPQFLTSTVHYDEEGRAIQSFSDNIKGGTDIASTQYHFDGRVLSTAETHNNPGTAYMNFSLVTKYKFDKIGRVTGIGKKMAINATVAYQDWITCPVMPDIKEEKDENYKIISSYRYNELGRMVKKTLSPNYNNGAGLETIDYSYNIRGWLTGINKDYALAETGNQWDRYFGMYIGYDNRDGKFAAAQLNGQATGVQWKSQGDNIARKYDYVYDHANRLIASNFKQYTDGSWNNTKADFSSKEITYDENGNLLTMTQMGVLPGGAAPIMVDKLNYLYNPQSNRLQSVTDIGGNAANGKQGDFKDGTNATGTADYSYDANGNMITDNNKRISSITYNHFDKPELITVAGTEGSTGTEGGGTIRYIYDAGGSKMQKVVTENPTTANGNQTIITTTTYIGAFIYVESSLNPPTGGQGGLQMVAHEEGRVRIITPYVNANDPNNIISGGITMPGGKQGVYDYFIKDNLANIRATVTEEINKASGVCTMEDANAIVKQNEEATFGNPGANNEVNTTRANKPTLWQANSSTKVSKLEALNSIPRTGPNALLKVMAGDKIRAMAEYYYVQDPGSSNSNGVNAMVGSFITSLAGGRTAAITHGQEAAISGGLSGNPALGSFFTNPATPDANPNAPRAYLNWIFFDEQFNFVQQVSGFKRVSQAGDGAVPLVLTEAKAIRNGYVYVYLSNESTEPVYFDNFAVTHERGQLIEDAHYYAYGLKIAAISSKSISSSLNKNVPKYGYQGAYSEELGEFELNYNEFFLRTYDPQIGRWTTSDPFDQFASPYNGMGMDPANNTDPTGGIVPIEPVYKALQEVIVYASKAAATTSSTLSAAMTITSISISTFATAGNIFLRDLQGPGNGSSTRDNPNLIGTMAHTALSNYLNSQNLVFGFGTGRWVTNEIFPNAPNLKPDIIDNSNKNVWELKPESWDPSTPGNKSYPNYLKAKTQIDNYVNEMNKGNTNLIGVFKKGGNITDSPVPSGPLPPLKLPSADGKYEFTYYVTNPASGIVYYKATEVRPRTPSDPLPPAGVKTDSKPNQDQKPTGKVVPMPKIKVDSRDAAKVAATATTVYIIFRIIRFAITIECGGCGAWAF